MYIFKDKGITYSNYVLERLSYDLSDHENYDINVSTFYNCREQGYVLNVHDENYENCMYLWIYAHRNSDEPTVTWAFEENRPDGENMYDNDSWTNRTRTFERIDDLVEHCKDLIISFIDVEK